VLVSHRHRFIYTKTHKTAGTSVESYFEPYCMAHGEWIEQHVREEYVSASGIIGSRVAKIPEGCKWWNHMSARQIKDQLGDEIWSSYYKFCVVRNPYDKAVSDFFFRTSREGKGEIPAAELPSRFESWLESPGPTIDRNKYLIARQFCLDDVIRYEKLGDDMERTCKRLGLPWTPDRLPEFKRGIRPVGIDLGRLYTDQSKRLVAAVYAFELSYFGYSFPA
jgi:hypothetical protein